jgi:hypothetical protein
MPANSPSGPNLSKKQRKLEISSLCSITGQLSLSSQESKCDFYIDSFVTSRFQGHMTEPKRLERSGDRNKPTLRADGLAVTIKCCPGPKVPKALCILLRVWAHHYKFGEDVKGKQIPTSDVYTLHSIGIGLFEDFVKGDSIIMRHIDTFNPNGSMALIRPPAPKPPLPTTDAAACGDLSSDFVVPIQSLLLTGSQTLQPAFAEYLQNISDSIKQYDKQKAKYPGGKPWSWEEQHPKIIRHPFGDIPMALFLRNRSQTSIPKEQVDSFVSNLLLRVLVEQGLSVEQYYKQPDKVKLMLTARLLRKITSLLTDYPDCFGESWTMPMAEASLTRASIDCEELATLCAAAFRALLATSDECKLCNPLKKIVQENYIGLHVLCLARFGPSKDPRGERSQVWMHVNYALMHKELFARLTRERKSDDRDTEIDLPGYILIEGSDDTQCSPQLEQMRPGLDYREVDAMDDPHSKTLGSFMSWRAEQKFRYYGYAVGFIRVDDLPKSGSDGKTPIEYTPLSRDSDGWSIGIPMSDLVEGVVEEQLGEHKLVAGPVVSAKLHKLSDMFARLYSDANCLGFDAKHADHCGYTIMDAKMADGLSARVPNTDSSIARVTFCAFDDKFKNKGLSMQARIDAAIAAVHSFGRRKKIKLYESLSAELLTDSLYYSGEGLPPAYCVVIRTGNTKTDGKKSGIVLQNQQKHSLVSFKYTKTPNRRVDTKRTNGSSPLPPNSEDDDDDYDHDGE